MDMRLLYDWCEIATLALLVRNDIWDTRPVITSLRSRRGNLIFILPCLYEIATLALLVRNDIALNTELSDKNKARYKQDKASADFSTGDLRKVNEREKTQA